MKFPLKKQLMFTFILMMSGIMFVSWIINAFFLTAIYSFGKRNNLLQAYEVIEYYSDENLIDSSEFAMEMERTCNINNINFIITDANSNTVKTSINDPEAFNHQLRDIIFSRYKGTQKIIEETDEYIICEIYDSDNQMEYIAMYGNLEGDNFFMLRTSLDGVRTSVKLASAFMMCVSFAVLLASTIVIHYVSKRISDPIIELAGISEKMSKLDFDTKYDGGSVNEIDILGQHMNEMSEKLEDTIGSLKTANLKLQEDVKAREAVDEMRKEFIANVSHELKTPIALIQGYAEGLQEGISEDPESRDYYCEVIIDETRKMNHLVQQLMSLSQLESGGDMNDMERFDIAGVIRNCIESDRLLAKQENIEITFEQEVPVYVWADEFKIEQVFRNYFSNAIHYCAGEKKIIVRIEQTKDIARICVFNTGNPVDEEAIPHLWDKFYKVDKARTREYGGSGIGLSIVKAIMESHHQKYGVKNYDNGVEFWFELSMR